MYDGIATLDDVPWFMCELGFAERHKRKEWAVVGGGNVRAGEGLTLASAAFPPAGVHVRPRRCLPCLFVPCSRGLGKLIEGLLRCRH